MTSARSGTVPRREIRVFGRVLGVPDIYIFNLDCPLQTLNHNVIKRTPDTVHADGGAVLCQQPRERLRGKLAALVGIEDIRTSTRCQRPAERSPAAPAGVSSSACRLPSADSSPATGVIVAGVSSRLFQRSGAVPFLTFHLIA